VRQNCSAYPAPHLHGTFAVWSKIKALLCLKRQPYGLRMDEESSPCSHGIVLFFARDAPYKPLSFNNKCSETFYFGQVLRDLA
jgi:hypothetical protein